MRRFKGLWATVQRVVVARLRAIIRLLRMGRERRPMGGGRVISARVRLLHVVQSKSTFFLRTGPLVSSASSQGAELRQRLQKAPPASSRVIVSRLVDISAREQPRHARSPPTSPAALLPVSLAAKGAAPPRQPPLPLSHGPPGLGCHGGAQEPRPPRRLAPCERRLARFGRSTRATRLRSRSRRYCNAKTGPR